MIIRNSYIELLVNGKMVELESQKSVNIRFNNVLQDPTKVSTTSAEYSFSFDLPCSPTNNQIFDHANNLSRLTKFHKRYNAELYADGTLIFKGSLTLNGVKDNKYNCNLVSIKTYNLEDIFGDTTMNQIKPMKRLANGEFERDENGDIVHTNWEIDFDGASSINAANFQGNPEVTFPLISYGCFAKKSVPEDAILPQSRPLYYGDYTSKFSLDNFNEWYYETWYPSHNMLATLRNAFETKNYIVQGDIFQDEYLKDIYMSVNLADEQVPDYNLGNPKFGKVDLTSTWVCPQDVPPQGASSGQTYGTECMLKIPTLPTYRPIIADGATHTTEFRDALKYNCDTVRVYDTLLPEDGGHCTIHQKSYMMQDSESLIVIPSDGFYKINMQVEAKLLQTSNITASQWIRDNTGQLLPLDVEIPHQANISFPPIFKITTPLEIQLVRNWTSSDDSGIELIKGQNGIIIYRNQADYSSATQLGTHENFLNCFPHEKVGKNIYQSQPTSSIERFDGESVQDKVSTLGWVQLKTDPMAFDPEVSEKFICGFTSWGNAKTPTSDSFYGGTGAVIKNGKSWSHIGADKKNQSMYNCGGYYSFLNNSFVNQFSNLNKNSLPQATYSFNQTTNTMTGTIQCLVRLNRNDVLRLVAVHRDYETTGGVKVSYATSATTHLTIEAASPKDQGDINARISKGTYNYNSPTEFDYNLNLANFFNKETKISDWVKDVQDAFNLDIIQDGNVITINKKKKNFGFGTAVNLDDRVYSPNISAKAINYPKSMAVKYKIDQDEWGAENSAVESYGSESVMNRDDWKKWIDSGYTEIMLNDDSYVTTKSEKQLKMAYTWYDTFSYYATSSQTQPTVEFRMPVISKFQYMVDGYDYEESRKHDGYGLAQRLWFKPHKVEQQIDLPLKNMNETVTVYVPTNYKNNFNLSYKNSEKSILLDYFDIKAYLSSNYIKVEAYITALEYNRLKNGALVNVDSDLYEVVKIDGYDCSGFNPTTLTLLKKVV